MNSGVSPRPPASIEDYALIGDGLSAALVGRDGSVDWLCWPNFDGDACLAALLGTTGNGRWLLAPSEAAGQPTIARRYRGDTMILETVFELDEGSVAVIDFMTVGGETRSLVRIAECRRGTITMHMDLVLRFRYGSQSPSLVPIADGCGFDAVAGRNRVRLTGDVPLSLGGEGIRAEFPMVEGQNRHFTLSWSESHLPAPELPEARQALRLTAAFWTDWSARCRYAGVWRDAVMRSLLTLKALSFRPTGAIVAAPTTSLPEKLGGVRNWDYRYCWVRDGSLTLLAFVQAGYAEEAHAWGGWLERAVAGNLGETRIMYDMYGDRSPNEWSPPWLPGYQGAGPVRIGNAASDQTQIDTHGEVMNALHLARYHGLRVPDAVWEAQKAYVGYLERSWEQPDQGIWEFRGEPRHYTHSKLMAWSAVDRAVRDAERFGLPAPLDAWRALRDRMHRTICEHGYDAEKASFVQSFGRKELDASLLQIAHVGFLPADDARLAGTVAAVERELMVDGLVLRYRTEGGADGLPPGEGAFLPCSFWLVQAYHVLGRDAQARQLFDRLLRLSNDLGLLSEEYDPISGRQTGNFPQAYSHLALACAAFALDPGGIDSLSGVFRSGRSQHGLDAPVFRSESAK